MTTPATPYVGARVRRNEDPLLLTGRGCYVDDINLQGMLHGALLRSPHAHADIVSLDVGAARALPGVTAVYTYADLTGGAAGRLPLMFKAHDAYVAPRNQYALAASHVDYVGQPIAFVVAESRYVAEDAVDLIAVQYDPLPAVVAIDSATRPGQPLVHPDIPDNIAMHLVQQTGDLQSAFDGAAHVFDERLVYDRGGAMPIETRGVVARWDEKEGGLTVWDSTQAPIPIRNGLSEILGLPQHLVRVIAPHVGGGFGTKLVLFYPEEVLVPWAAVGLGRSVKWIEDRREHFVASSQERVQIHYARVAVNADGTIRGVEDRFFHEEGAYTPYGPIVPLVASTSLPGPYKLPAYYTEFTSVYTNKGITSPYRGAGRPHGVFVMERLIARIARELRLDPQEVRRRNLIQPDAFPYEVGLIYQDGAPVRYDSGQYPLCLQKALDLIGYNEFRTEQAEARRQGRFVGAGASCYVEGSGVGPYEGARIHVENTGKVLLATGVGTQGQSHYTVLAQIAADLLGVDPADVSVVTGDTGAFPWGTGTFASRAGVVAGNATYRAAQAVRAKIQKVAARVLGVAPDDIDLGDGRAFVRTDIGRAMTLAEVALAANPVRGTMPDDDGPGLEATRYYAPPQGAFANGVHACTLEVDVDTGMVQFLKYVVVHDCGKVLNPLVLDGQIIGGLAQGVGNAFYEQIVYDENGQMLTTTFMDYLLPTAAEMPQQVTVAHVETPSPLNPLGAKGAGEGGVIPVGAVFAEAVEDALAPLGVVIREIPLSPNKLRRLIADAQNLPE